MTYPVPSFDEIRNKYLTTLQNGDADFDIATDSDNYIRGTAIASVVEGLYAYVGWTFRQIFPDTADEENMRHHAGMRSVRGRDASFAVGTAQITGAVGSVLLAGDTFKTDAGVVYALLGSSVTITASPMMVNVIAVNAGATGNIQNGSGNWSIARGGIDGAVTQVTLSGGADAESAPELLKRFLELLRNPPAGGKPADLKRWAEEVPGVAQAIVVTRLRGLGTTDVYICADGGMPSAQLLSDVLAKLINMSPAGIKDIAVRAPTDKIVDVAFAIKGVGDFETVLKPAAVSLTQAYFATFGAGDAFVLSKFEALISAQANVTDRKVIIPAANVEVGVSVDAGDTVMEWLRLGSVTVTQMD